jgi:hypothetical protein
MAKKNKFLMKLSHSIFLIFLALVLGLLAGALFFSRVETRTDVCQDSGGDFCYSEDMNYYVANPVTDLPSDWDYYVVGKDVDYLNSQLCLNVNRDKSDCLMIDVCPNCATDKISCVCRE